MESMAEEASMELLDSAMMSRLGVESSERSIGVERRRTERGRRTRRRANRKATGAREAVILGWGAAAPARLKLFTRWTRKVGSSESKERLRGTQPVTPACTSVTPPNLMLHMMHKCPSPAALTLQNASSRLDLPLYWLLREIFQHYV